MRKIMMLLFTVVLAVSVSAQRVIVKGGGPVVRPRPVVVVGGGFGYSPFYSPYYGFGYNPYWHNRFFYNRPYYNRPSKLEVKIQDIRNDYADKIWSARQDKSLTGKDKRHEIKKLRHERDQRIDDLKSNYYKQQ